MAQEQIVPKDIQNDATTYMAQRCFAGDPTIGKYMKMGYIQGRMEERAKCSINTLSARKVISSKGYSLYFKTLVEYHIWRKEQNKNNWTDDDMKTASREGYRMEGCFHSSQFDEWLEQYKLIHK